MSHFDAATMLAMAAEHGGNPDDPNKRHPLDFVLWQPSLPDEPSWESRWGPGRPGWHIECSALALRELGETIDVHGGGRDLVFPHHECETAQSESVTGRPFVRHWLHVGLVGLDGTKMSKSLGNLVFVGDLLKEWEPAAIRLALLGHHYRADWEWTDEDMPRAAARLQAWRAASRPSRPVRPPEPPGPATGRPGLELVRSHLDDDLDTPGALVALDDEAAAGRPVVAGAALLGRYPVDPGDRSAADPASPGSGTHQPEAREAHPWQPSPSDFPMARPRSSTPAPPPSSSPSPSAPAWPRRRWPPPSTGSRSTSTPRCADGARVSILTAESDAGRAVLRHSTAHVLAQAVLRLWPGAHYAIGPVIEDGFYYDFELPGGAHFSDEDLERIEATMREIMAEDQPFVRHEHTIDEGPGPLRGPTVQAGDHRGGGRRSRRGGRPGRRGRPRRGLHLLELDLPSPTCAAAPTSPPPAGSATSP